jgi:hypothetical protein
VVREAPGNDESERRAKVAGLHARAREAERCGGFRRCAGRQGARSRRRRAAACARTAAAAASRARPPSYRGPRGGGGGEDDVEVQEGVWRRSAGGLTRQRRTSGDRLQEAARGRTPCSVGRNGRGSHSPAGWSPYVTTAPLRGVVSLCDDGSIYNGSVEGIFVTPVASFVVSRNSDPRLLTHVLRSYDREARAFDDIWEKPLLQNVIMSNSSPRSPEMDVTTTVFKKKECSRCLIRDIQDFRCVVHLCKICKV